MMVRNSFLQKKNICCMILLALATYHDDVKETLQTRWGFCNTSTHCFPCLHCAVCKQCIIQEKQGFVFYFCSVLNLWSIVFIILSTVLSHSAVDTVGDFFFSMMCVT
jgi:hypothetical protein